MEGNRFRDMVLTQEQSERLIKKLSCAQSDIVKKRNEFLSNTDQFQWREDATYSFSVEIPTLDLNFVKADMTFSYNLTQEVVLERKTAKSYMNSFEKVQVTINVGNVLNETSVMEESYYCDYKMGSEYNLEMNDVDKQAA